MEARSLESTCMTNMVTSIVSGAFGCEAIRCQSLQVLPAWNTPTPENLGAFSYSAKE